MSAQTFRKKPVEIQAVRVKDALTAATTTWSDLPRWLVDAYERGNVLFLPHAILIKTLEGEMRGDRSDWIIQGVQGELYPCKPDIFEATYELVEP